MTTISYSEARDRLASVWDDCILFAQARYHY